MHTAVVYASLSIEYYANKCIYNIRRMGMRIKKLKRTGYWHSGILYLF